VNGTVIILNTISLLIISFMPFPTSLLGEFPYTAIPLVIYGLTLMASNVMGFVILVYVHRNPYLLKDGVHSPTFLSQNYRQYIWVNTSYLIAMVLAFYQPVISYAIYLLVLIGVGLILKKQMNRTTKETATSHLTHDR